MIVDTSVMTHIDHVAEQLPLGGLERWLTDDTVSEIMVNGAAPDRPGEVWVEQHGDLRRAGHMSVSAVQGAIERLLSPLGRRIDRLAPVVDARLADGSRICAVIPPVAVDGIALTVRRFGGGTRPLADFCSSNAESAAPAEQLTRLLRGLIARRCNVLISGATSTGKTTLLGALAAAVPGDQRIVVLEDTAELRIEHSHVVRLEARPPTAEGVGAIDLAGLLRTALRLRPDRLVVGEVRGAEAIALLHALNTGHHGSMSTIHANSARDAIARLQTLVLQESPGWPLRAIDDHIARAVDIVVHVARHGAQRTISEVAEVTGADEHGVHLMSLLTDGAVLRSPTRSRA
jgi:pilus assembly protein CpaF